GAGSAPGSPWTAGSAGGRSRTARGLGNSGTGSSAKPVLQTSRPTSKRAASSRCSWAWPAGKGTRPALEEEVHYEGTAAEGRHHHWSLAGHRLRPGRRLPEARLG